MLVNSFWSVCLYNFPILFPCYIPTCPNSLNTVVLVMSISHGLILKWTATSPTYSRNLAFPIAWLSTTWRVTIAFRFLPSLFTRMQGSTVALFIPKRRPWWSRDVRYQCIRDYSIPYSDLTTWRNVSTCKYIYSGAWMYIVRSDYVSVWKYASLTSRVSSVNLVRDAARLLFIHWENLGTVGARVASAVASPSG